jgi:hypothetical protein
MAVDIVAKLLLQTEDYQKNIKAARAEMKQFEEAGATVKSFITKMAVSLGAATTATAAFQKIIGSSRTLSKAFGEDLTEAKASVDTFFNAMAVADFSNFTNTMQDAISSAKEYYDQLGKLKTFQVFNNVDIDRIRRDMAKAKIVLVDKKSTEQQKQEAKKLLKDLDNEMLGKSKQLSALAYNTYYADLRAKLKSYGVAGSDSSLNNSIIKNVKESGNYDSAVKRLNELDKKAKSTMQKVYTYSTNAYGSTFSSYKMVATAATKAITNSIEYKTLRAIKEMGNEALKEAKGYEDLAINSETDAYNQIYTNLRKIGAGSKGSGAGKSGTSNSKTEVGPIGSISDLKAKIAELQKKYEVAADDGTRIGLMNAINTVSDKIKQTNFFAEIGGKRDIGPLTTNKTTKLSTSTSLEKALNEKIEPLITEKQVKNAVTYGEALTNLGSAMSYLNNATGSGAAGWASYGVNSMKALGNTYSALVKVIPALKVEAILKAMGSASDAPIVGWINAIAAASAMIATISSLPKFANGGIIEPTSGFIPGNQFSDDKILARVNAGELILNKAQQKNLATKLTSVPEVIMKGLNLNVNFVGRISGRDLEFVLDKRKQYNKYAL